MPLGSGQTVFLLSGYNQGDQAAAATDTKLLYAIWTLDKTRLIWVRGKGSEAILAMQQQGELAKKAKLCYLYASCGTSPQKQQSVQLEIGLAFLVALG
ncbi:MAG: hypothetical protein WBG73_18070 [Coleofasciculaceae cyanobacterium]